MTDSVTDLLVERCKLENTNITWRLCKGTAVFELPSQMRIAKLDKLKLTNGHLHAMRCVHMPRLHWETPMFG